MKIPARTARWFVSPAENSVTLTIDALEHRMSIEEADRLSELLDEAALFARGRSVAVTA